MDCDRIKGMIQLLRFNLQNKRVCSVVSRASSKKRYKTILKGLDVRQTPHVWSEIDEKTILTGVVIGKFIE